MFEGPRNDAPLGGGIVDALHGEALAAAGLPVREDGAVVALQHTLGQIQTVSCHCYQTLFRCEASLLVGVSVRTYVRPSRQVLKSYII